MTTGRTTMIPARAAPRPGRALLFVLLVVLAGAGSGCTTGTHRAEDEGVWFPTLRLSAEASPGRARGAEGDPGLGREMRSGALSAIEGEISYAVGEDSGVSDEAIEIGGALFPAGAQLESEFRLFTAMVAGAAGYRTETGLEAALLGGFEYAALDLEVDGALQSGDTDEKDLGLLLGARARWLVTEELRLYAQSRISGHIYALTQSEVGAEVRIVPRLALFAGYRRTEYRRDDGGDSEIVLRWKGIVAGIQLEF